MFYGAAGATCLAIVLTSSGAFDTDELTFSHRYSLWQIVCTLIVGQAIVLDARLARLLPNLRALAASAAVCVTVLLTSIELHALKFTPLLPKEPDPPLEFLLFVAPPVSAIAAVSLLLKRARSGGMRKAQVPDGPASDPASTAQHDALAPPPPPSPLEMNAWPDDPVLRVQADDHYLHVTTLRGTSLIRGRMKDALARLQTVDGLQVHRSHWIANEAVARVALRGRDYYVRLKDGTEIPVGRSRIGEIRARGWL
jgi:hypothetical protein